MLFYYNLYIVSEFLNELCNELGVSLWDRIRIEEIRKRTRITYSVKFRIKYITLCAAQFAYAKLLPATYEIIKALVELRNL